MFPKRTMGQVTGPPKKFLAFLMFGGRGSHKNEHIRLDMEGAFRKGYCWSASHGGVQGKSRSYGMEGWGQILQGSRVLEDPAG